MIITLPKSPSVNHLYGVSCRGGFPHWYIGAKGKAWFEEAGYIIKLAYKHKVPYEGDISLYIKFYTARTSDLDNIFKCTQDLLQKSGIVKNDRQIVFIQGERIKVKTKDEKIEIEIPEI